MLDGGDVFQLVNDGFNEGSLSQQQGILHSAPQFVDELYSGLLPELFCQLLRNIALAAKTLPKICCNSLGTGVRSSVLPGVRVKLTNSPLSFEQKRSSKRDIGGDLLNGLLFSAYGYRPFLSRTHVKIPSPPSKIYKTAAILSTTCSSTSGSCTKANRTNPSPDFPNPAPGETATPVFSTR